MVCSFIRGYLFFALCINTFNSQKGGLTIESANLSTTLNTNPSFNILIMNENAKELDITTAVYTRAISDAKLEDIVSRSSGINISTANNKPNAKKIIKRQYESNPKCFQIFHIPELIAGTRGEEFVDELRREFENKNFGAILAVNDGTELDENESRNHGVYGYVKKPLTVEGVLNPLHAAIDMVLLKSKPPKKEVKDVFIFRPLLEEGELLAYYKKRFEIWNNLNYIPSEFKSATGLEIDDYDKYSIPLGGFSVNGHEKLAIISRIITSRIQKDYLIKTQGLIKKFGDTVLNSAFERIPDSALPIVESCRKKNRENELVQFLDRYGGLKKSVEYSRLMITDKSCRGGGVSTKMALFHNMYARFVLNSNIGLAECLASHVPHNTSTNGFTGEIPGLGTIDAVRVEQIAKAIYVDLRNNPRNAQLENTRRMFAKYGFFCACDRNDCIDNGYILEKSTECKRKILGYEC